MSRQYELFINIYTLYCKRNIYTKEILNHDPEARHVHSLCVNEERITNAEWKKHINDR